MYLEINFENSKEKILEQLSANKDILWVSEIIDFLNNWWNEGSSFVVHTSGSTGVPKQLNIEKSKAVNSAKMTGNFFSFNESTNAFLCMSPKFIAGKLMLVRAIVWRMNMICIEPSSNPLNEVPVNLHIDFAAMVPLQLQNSISEINSSRIKNLIVGGGAVDDKLMAQISKSNTEIYSTYGMTETITHIALKKLNGESHDDTFRALSGVKLSIDNRNCLVINAKSISNDEVITNDIVELRNENEFVWVGRFDNVINSGGVKIHPEKIEELLSAYIKPNFFLSALEDEVLGEKAVLIIEGGKMDVDLDFIKNLVPKYHNPKEVLFVEEFVRTDSGKIMRDKTLLKALNTMK